VVVFVVRDGNPTGIHGWDDLVKEGVEVVTPNPFTSGGARWNVMAAYGAQLEQGKTEEQARDYLTDLFHNVTVQDKSARESLTTFAAGKGDVLLAYENEAIFAKQQGQPFEYIVPDETILIENPVAATTDASAAGKEFVDFLFTDEAQKVYGDEGYRPVSKTVLATFDFPYASVALHDRRPGRLEQRPDRVLRPRVRLHGQSAEGGRAADRVAARESASSAPAAAAAGTRRTACRRAGSRACTPRSRRRSLWLTQAVQARRRWRRARCWPHPSR
jgi:hypothetical protein